MTKFDRIKRLVQYRTGLDSDTLAAHVADLLGDHEPADYPRGIDADKPKKRYYCTECGAESTQSNRLVLSTGYQFQLPRWDEDLRLFITIHRPIHGGLEESRWDSGELCKPCFIKVVQEVLSKEEV
jgi:hypothetical protein